MPALIVTKETMQSEVVNSEKTVLLDFWAPWCGPCRMLGPVIDQIANEAPHIKVVKVNIDLEPELAQEFSVMSIPTLVVIKGGEETNRAVGVIPKAAILELLNEK